MSRNGWYSFGIGAVATLVTGWFVAGAGGILLALAVGIGAMLVAALGLDRARERRKGRRG